MHALTLIIAALLAALLAAMIPDMKRNQDGARVLLTLAWLLCVVLAAVFLGVVWLIEWLLTGAGS